MKHLSAIFSAAFFLFLLSCNDNSKDKEEKAAADSSAMAATPTPPPPPPAEPVFTPFKTVTVRHKVKDYSKWLPVYMSHDSMRTAYGITRYRVGRGIEDSNMVLVIDKITDEAKAKEFGNSATLKDAMQKGGVVSKPDISFYNVIRSDDSNASTADRVAVTTKVKDFATFIKVYDGEGKSTRAENGLVDRAMGRSFDDSNTIRLVFVVTDMAKAKARMTSPELKKLMDSSGVVSKPDFFWYKLVQQ